MKRLLLAMSMIYGALSYAQQTPSLQDVTSWAGTEWASCCTYVQKNPITALGTVVGTYSMLYLIRAQRLSEWASAPERWSSWMLQETPERTLPEELQTRYPDACKLHELAGNYSALAEIEQEISQLLQLKIYNAFLNTYLYGWGIRMPEMLVNKRVLALIQLQSIIAELSTKVRTRLRALAL